MVFGGANVCICLFAAATLGQGAAQDLLFRRTSNARITAVVDSEKFHVISPEMTAGSVFSIRAHRLIPGALFP